MKSNIQNLILDRTFYRLFNVRIISIFYLIFIVLLFFLISFLFYRDLRGKFFVLLIMLFIFSVLPILNFLLDKLDSVISPASYNDLYVKTVDSILNIDSFDEITNKIFDLVVKLLNAGFGYIIFYLNESRVIELKYQLNKAYELTRREKTENDDILLKQINGQDTIIKVKNKNLNNKDRQIMKALENMGVEVVVPIYYNNKISGIIAIGAKKRFSEREIKLLKLVAFKLALLSVNSFYFYEIRKREEVEKEYELTNKIQKQFLPNPDIDRGKIKIRAYHNTVSSFTREFYDIFVNDSSCDDIRISAYHVIGDVKETSIFMPGVQAVLQSYARLGFSAKESIAKLNNFVKERDVLDGDLMIFHSSISQSGKFVCCSSNYPCPLYYKNSAKRIMRLSEKESNSAYIDITIEPGDIIIAACAYYSKIISNDIPNYTLIINQNKSLPLERIRDMLVEDIIDSQKNNSAIENINSGEDQLLILISMEDAV